MSNKQIVSFDDELLIVVDANDKVLDYKSKVECHTGDGILHRAFSIFIFNTKGELILQQRSNQKLLWPLFWSNSCCSHPRKGESLEDATHRRLEQELGIKTDLQYLYTFQYHEKFGHKGSEYEMCAVLIGSTDEQPKVNENEISAWKYISQEDLNHTLDNTPDSYTPWFKMEWHMLTERYMTQIRSIL
jgi:isopentenyl-diphosphate delta-isomerase